MAYIMNDLHFVCKHFMDICHGHLTYNPQKYPKLGY